MTASDGVLTGRRVLGEVDAKRLLAEIGLRVPAGQVVCSADDAARAADAIGYPVVVKVASADILHKSDVGGVVLNLTTPEQVAASFERVIMAARRARPDAQVH